MNPTNFRVATLAACAALACAGAAAQGAMPAASAPAVATTTTTSTTTTTTTVTKLAGPAAVAAAHVTPAAGSGIDRHGMDPTVRPQDDLYLSMNGEWVRDTAIPADKSRWGTFLELRDRSDAQVRAVIEALHGTHPAAGRSTTSTAPSWTPPRSTAPASRRSPRR